MRKILFFVVLLLSQIMMAATAGAEKPRYIWIDAAANFVEFANSKENIARDLQKAVDAGFTDIVVDVRGTNGDVLFNTTVAGVEQATKLPTWEGGTYHFHERTETWDYLQAFIDAGHAVGLKVHAAINTFVGGKAYKYGLDSQGLVFRDPSKRDWVNTLYYNGERVNTLDLDVNSIANDDKIKDHLTKFLNPANDEVQEFLLSLISDLAKYDDLDGIFLDRCRYADEYSDFSDVSKQKFEEYLGYTISDFPACISSTYEKEWWAFRAKISHDFIVKAREAVKTVNSNIQFGTYVAAWYSDYNEYGVNWASPRYDASSDYEWANTDWNQYGYADHLDFMLLGAYAGTDKIYGSTEWTCQGFCQLAKEKLMGDVLFAGGPDVGNGDGYDGGGQGEAVTQTIDACINAADGYFLFDMCHVRKYEYWDDIKTGVSTYKNSNQPYIHASSDRVNLSCRKNQTATATVTVDGNLLNSWTYVDLICPEEGVFSVTPTGLQVSGSTHNFSEGWTTLTIKFSPTENGSWGGDIDNDYYILLRSVDTNGNDVYKRIDLYGVATDTADETETDYRTITTKNAGKNYDPINYMFAKNNDGWLMYTPGQTVAKQFAVANGVIYHIVPGHTITNKNGEEHQSITATPSYNSTNYGFSAGQGLDSGCEAYYAGRGIAADNYGNIIYPYSTTDTWLTNYTAKVGGIAVLKGTEKYGEIVDTNTRKEIIDFRYVYRYKLRGSVADWIANKDSDYSSGRTDFFYASGNCYDGTGYVWFTDGVEVVRITIENVSGEQRATKQDVYQITGDGFVTPTGEYEESRIKPYGNDCFLLQNQTGVYDCKLVDGVMQVQQVIRGSNYQRHAANIANFHGQKILVLDAIEGGNREGQLNIYNMNTDDISTATSASIGYYINAMSGTYAENDTDNNVTFLDNLPAGDMANIDTWCEFGFDPNGNQLHLHTYCPGVGYAKFTINTVKNIENNPVTTVNASLETSIDNQYQNANITWDASGVTDHASTRYKIYYRTSPFISGEDGKEKTVVSDGYSDWQELVTTEAGATSYTHVDVKYLNHGTEFYERSYQYRVLPVVDGKNYQNNASMPTVTPVWLSVDPVWASYNGEEGKGAVTYAGYNTVQLFWAHGVEGGKGNRPTSYDVYRNGIKIATTALHNYVDYEAAENKEHTYQIVAHYEGKPGIETKSTTKTITVGSKNPEKPQYRIEEVYNYRIGNEDGKVKPREFYSNFTDPYYYRQGIYFRGDWYIAQRANGDGGNGGIIKFHARGQDEKYTPEEGHPGDDILHENHYKKYDDFEANSGTNVGIAMDDYGNIFVRYADDEYSNAFTRGHIMRAYYSYSVGEDWESEMTLDNTANGALLKGHSNYEDLTPIKWQDNKPIAYVPAYFHDFSNLKFTDVNTGETLTGIPGRCDYYFMEGNAFSEDLINEGIATTDNGAILYVSPSGSNTIYRIRLNTSAVDGIMDATGIDAYTIPGTSTATGNEFGNYAFHVDRRDDYIFNHVTNGYFNIGKTSDNPTGKHVPIYETHSGISNAGGSTLQFNNELFMVYPHSYHSTNTGDFTIGIAEREGDESTEGANLNNIIPIATFNQKEISDAPSQNVNGQWLYAELGLLDGTPLWLGKKFKVTSLNDETQEEEEEEVYLSTDNILKYAECIYIYQYVPGVRFAKYRLTIPQVFPHAEPRLSVYPVYTDAEGKELNREGNGGIEQGTVPEEAIEIDRLDGNFEWKFITYESPIGANIYELEGYHLTIADQYGNKYTHVDGNNKYTINEIYYYATGEKYTVTYTDANGNVATKTYEKGTDADFQEYKVEVTDAEGKGTGEYKGVMQLTDLYSNNDKIYSATMTVDYICLTGSIKGEHFLSAEARVENDNGFAPVAPNGEVVVYRSLDWGDWSGAVTDDPNTGLYKGKPYFDNNGNPVLPDPEDVYWDVYQVAMNIDEPEFNTGKEEPVSYYTIHVAKTNDGTSWIDKFDVNDTIKSDRIKDIMLYIGQGETFDGVSADANGYIDCGVLYDGKIPGTHKFVTAEATPKNTPDVYWIERFYLGYYEGKAGSEYEIKKPDLVEKRRYYVVAHYAAGTPKKNTTIEPMAVSDEGGNSKIYAQRHADLAVTLETENLPTGVENLELTANISVYPIPATVSITIKCDEAIENVAIYSLAGVKVKEMSGEGEQIMTVAVDDMEAGYYMLCVNGYAPIKFLKK